MPLLTLPKDISEMQDEFTSLPTGSYEGIIDRVNIGKTQKGNPKIDVMWKNKGEEGGVVWDTVALNVDFKVKQYAKLLGVDAGNTIDTDLLIGAEGILDVVAESYTNPTTGETSTRPKIKRISPVA
ncbi:MAG: hypothetical protein KAU20_05805 [Nanoarchaeota archaeon]|nr:hypothetical protein [Nanoarchaeota archaeon]